LVGQNLSFSGNGENAGKFSKKTPPKPKITHSTVVLQAKVMPVGAETNMKE
jgi:hypothetical protein